MLYISERLCQLREGARALQIETTNTWTGTDRKFKFMQISRVVTFIMHKNTKSQISIDFEKAMPGILILVENHKWKSTTEEFVKIDL